MRIRITTIITIMNVAPAAIMITGIMITGMGTSIMRMIRIAVPIAATIITDMITGALSRRSMMRRFNPSPSASTAM